MDCPDILRLVRLAWIAVETADLDGCCVAGNGYARDFVAIWVGARGKDSDLTFVAA